MAGLPTGSAGLRAGAFGVADQCLVSLANLAVGLAAARVMAPADFGVYVIAFAVSLAGGSVQQSLITDPLVILGAPRAGAGQAAYVSSLLRVQILCALLVSLVVGTVAGALHLAWGATSSIPAALAAVAAIALPVQLQGFLRALYFTRLQPASVLANDIVYALLRLGAVAALVATDRLTTVSALLAAGAAAAAAFLIGAPGCRTHLLARPEPLERTWSAHWSYGRWLLATAGAYWCSGQAPALMAGGLLTPVASAILKACQFLVSPLYVVFAGLDGVLAPRAARLAASAGAAALARFLKLFGLCAAAGVLLYAVVLLPAAPWLMDVVYKGRYVEYSAIVGVLLLDALLTALSRAPVLGLKVSGDTRRIFHANLCSAVAGLTAMLVLAPRLGIFGAALAAPVSSLSLFVFLLIRAPRVARPAVPVAGDRPVKLLVIAGATFADPASRGALSALAAGGMKVTLAMPRQVIHDFAPRAVPEAPEAAPGVQVIRVPLWVHHRNGTHLVFRGLRRLLRETQPDVVHCVMEPWSMTCLQICVLLPTLKRRPLLGLQPCESKPEQGGWLGRRIRQRLYRHVLHRCDYFIGWSGVVVAAARRMGLNGVPVATVPPVGVDTGLFQPAGDEEKARLRAELGLGGTTGPLVGYAGRFVEEKGLRDLVSAADLAVAQDSGLHLALLGDGPLRAWLQAATTTRPWMSLHARRDQMGVARFMRALDGFVLPSRTTPRWEEQFGLVLAEAMSCGLIVIGSTCGAIPEVIDNAGRVFTEGDVPSLASALAGMAGDAEIGAARARERAASKYSSAIVASTIVGTIERAQRRVPS